MSNDLKPMPLSELLKIEACIADLRDGDHEETFVVEYRDVIELEQRINELEQALADSLAENERLAELLNR
jgi:hypothetical protein